MRSSVNFPFGSSVIAFRVARVCVLVCLFTGRSIADDQAWAAARTARTAHEAGPTMASIDRAKYVVQLGAMRNASGVGPGDVGAVMREAARSRAAQGSDTIIVENADTALVRRAYQRRIPVLLVDGTLNDLSEAPTGNGSVTITAHVDLVVRKVPQHTLRGLVSGKASASDGNTEQSDVVSLQNLAVGGAVASAMSSVVSEIAILAK